MTRPRLFTAALPVLLLVGASCGAGPSRLDGSISSRTDLTFDSVRAEWLLDQVAVRYVAVGASLSSDAARLTVPESKALEDVDLDVAADVLVEHFRYSWDDDGRLITGEPFPAVDHGTLRFSKVGKKLGERVSGSFAIVFVGGDTLNGDFDAEVVEPDPNR